MTVPHLNLAPKRKRPLSLWNPLDYLLLLYWVFFFPQALRWYVDTFGGGYIPESEMNWRKGLEILRQNPSQRQLLIQGLLLTVIVPLVLSRLLQELGVPVDWVGVALGVALGVAFGVAGCVAGGVAILRPDNWLLGFPFTGRLLAHQGLLFARLTPLPLPSLTFLLQKWLRQDWEAGIDNLNQLLAYSLQFIPVIRAVNRVLAEIPDGQLIYRASQLAENPFDWKLLQYASASCGGGQNCRLFANSPTRRRCLAETAPAHF